MAWSSIALGAGFKSACFEQQLSRLQGALHRTKAKGLKPHGGVSLVLGAGNQASVMAGHRVNLHMLTSACFETRVILAAGSHIQDQSQGAEVTYYVAHSGVALVLGAGNQALMVAEHQVNPHTLKPVCF